MNIDNLDLSVNVIILNEVATKTRVIGVKPNIIVSIYLSY